MNSKAKYECNECSELHDDFDEARECCPPQIIEVFLCGHCRENYGIHEELADDCCSDADPDAPPIINQAELEAAGQMRLCA